MATSAAYIDLTEGAAPATPASGKVRVYAKTDGSAYQKDDAGTETGLAGGGGGSVATDAIWDAAGDLAVGSGANTAAKLAIGANRYLLKSDGTTAAWALPSWVGASIKETTAQSVANDTDAAMASNEENEDTDGWHESVTNPTRMTNPFGVTIKVRVTATAFFAADADGFRQVFFKVSGTSTEKGFMRVFGAGGVVGTYVSTSADLTLTSGQYVEMWVHHLAGAALNVSMIDFTITLIGLA